jgi:hypothetical protein
MKLPRVRFTVRRMMVAVAVVGCILAIGIVALRLWKDLGSPTIAFGSPVVVYVMPPGQSLGLLALVTLGTGAAVYWWWMGRQRRDRRKA